MNGDDRFERGTAAYASQFGMPQEEVFPYLRDNYGERFAREAINVAAEAWTDDVLSLRDRSLIVVAVLATQGGVDARLRGHVRWALEHGATREELEALIALLAVYAGFPRASAAGELVQEVISATTGG